MTFDPKVANGRWPSILSAMGVDAKTLSGRNVACPFCGGKDRFRFTDHEQAGVWLCNKCGQGNGYHFIQRWNNCDFKAARAVVERYLPSAAEVKPKPVRDPRSRLNAIWKQCVPGADVVADYLAARGLKLIDPSPELRGIESLPYFQDGKHVSSHNAMVARVRDGTGKPTTLHVTYLDDNLKAAVPSPKKVLSKMGEGAHVRLYPVIEGQWLNVTEGIETAIAVREHVWEPTWAMISASGLTGMVIPKGIAGLRIWGDNDSSFAGQAHAYALAYRARNEGVPVVVNIPEKTDTDWADSENRAIMSSAYRYRRES